jgi:hypothetical protein
MYLHSGRKVEVGGEDEGLVTLVTELLHRFDIDGILPKYCYFSSSLGGQRSSGVCGAHGWMIHPEAQNGVLPGEDRISHRPSLLLM